MMTQTKRQSYVTRACLVACVFVLLGAGTCGAQEFRAFWVDAWGAGILNQSQVDTLLGVPGTSSTGQIRDANCNAIIVQVRRNCDALYPSSMGEPFMTGITPANFNGLQAAINAAHDTTGGKKRIEVHAWIVTFRTSGGLVYTQHSDTPTGSLTELDNYWPSRTDAGAETSDKNFDPGHPLAADYTVNVAMDIVNNFDVDGIHFDYIRYTANNEGYNPTSVARYNARYGLTGQPTASNEQWKQWRRDQITQMLRKVYAKTQASKPSVKVSGSFVTWNPSPTASTRAAFQATRPYYDVYSDWDAWVQEGIVDLAVPMTYYNWASLPTDYTKWMNFEKDRKFNRHMVVGPGIYLNSLDNAILELQMTRNASPAGNYAHGFSGYSYRTPYSGGTWAAFSPRLLTDVTPTWADIPAMPWKVTPTKGHISGTVTDMITDKWIDGATVSITGPENRSMLTDGTGFYAFIDLTPGNYTITASKTGYPNSVKTANIVLGGVTGNMYVRDFQLGNPGPVISNVQSSSITGTTATITWNTDAAADSKVEYGLTTSYGSSSPLYPGMVYAHSVSLSGLNPGTLYHYRVISTNADGSTTSGDYTFTTLPPPAISGVQASAITNSSATVIWTTDQGSSSQVQYGLTAAYGSTTTLDPALVTSHSVPISGLAQNTLYHYRVISTNANGTATSGDYTFTTSGPPTMSNIQVTSITSTTATITWSTSAPSDSTVNYGLTTSYGSAAGDGTLVTSHSVTLTGLAMTTLYHFQCVSTNAYGSATSTDLTFTTSALPTISNVQITDITSSSATITWTTDQGADTRVNYGTTTAYGSLYSSPPLVTSHSATVGGLSASTLYHFQCVSVNANGTATTGDYTFTTGFAPADIIIDNSGATFGGTATWTTVTGAGYNNDYRWVLNRKTSSTANCTWRPTIVTEGYYNVYAIWPAASNHTPSATYSVYYNGGNTSTTVNQTTDGMAWMPIATNVQFAAGTGGYVYLTNLTGQTNGLNRVIADAVKFVWVAPLGPPTITDVQATNITTAGVTITWTTNQVADSQVEYGLTTSYGSTQSDSALVNSHSVALTGLAEGTKYHYRVTSTSPTGTTTSADFTFTTAMEMIVDDVDAGATSTGTWTVGTFAGGYNNTYKFADGAASSTAEFTWTPNLPRVGTYDVYCWYTSGANRTTAAQYQIHYSGGTQTVPVNQTVNGSQWILMATGLPFNSGTSGYVTVDNNIGAGVVVIADAIRWVFTGGPEDPNPPTLSIGSPSAAVAAGGPVSYTVSYSDDVGVTAIALSPSDITLNKTGTANGNVSVTGSGNATRTVTISGITGNGTLGISIAAGTAADGAGNTAPAAGPSATFEVDNIAPTIQIGAPSNTMASTGPVTYTVTYSGADAVTLADANVTLNKTGTANGNVSVTGSGTATRTVTVSGITGNGTLGISIAAGTAVDLAGNTAPAAGPSATFGVDATAPVMSAVTDEQYTTSTSSLYATWSGSDAESGIQKYEYAVGSTSGGVDVKAWTDAGTATSATIDGISLAVGQTYYISVRATNNLGLVSDPMTSAGVAVAYIVASVAEAKAKPDNTPVALPATMVVTAKFANCFYVEDSSRVAGIRVDYAGALEPNQTATIIGKMGLTADNERAILSPKVTAGAMGTAIEPFLVVGKAVGGGALGFTPGMTNSVGLNNTGLLVKIAGKVTYQFADGFYLNDGVGVTDETGHAGIRVYTGDLGATNYVDSLVVVTGVVSCRKPGAVVPYILSRSFIQQ